MLSGGFILASTAAARFEKQMSEVDAVTNATAADLDRLSAAAIQAGKDTQFSATEAAKAEAELAKAGVSTADILGGALSGSLDLAAAGQLDLAEASDIAAKAMNVFGLKGGDVGHIADVLAASANKSATDVHEMGEALRMGGLAARNAGLSIEDTVGALSAFADSALVGSDAGTSLKTMLQFLAAPTQKAKGLMEELGIEVYDAQGNFVGITRLAGILQRQLSGLTQEQRQQALATIFGADAMRAATVLYNRGEEGIREYITAVNDEGAAKEAAQKKTDNLIGDIERLTGSLETLAIQSGTGTNEGLRSLTQGAGALVDRFSALPGPLQTSITMIAAVGGVALLAFSGFIKLRGKSAELAEQLTEMGPAGQRAARGLEATTKWAGRAAAAFTVLQIVGTVVDSLGDTTDIESLNNAVKELGESGEVTGELARMFGKDLGALGDEAALASAGIGGVFRTIESVLPGSRQLNEAINDTSWSGAAERWRLLDDALAQLVRSGHLEDATGAYHRLMKAANLTADEIEAVTPRYNDAIMEADRATRGQANTAGVAVAANQELTKALDEQADKAEDLVAEWDRLNGRMLGNDELRLDTIEAIKDVGKAFEDNRKAFENSGNAIQGNSEAALRNRIAMGEAARQAVETAQAYLAQGGTAAGAAKLMEDFKKQTIEASGTTGTARKRVEELAAQLFKLPTTVPINVKVSVTGTAQAWSELRALERKAEVAVGRRWGGVTVHAATGLLREAAMFTPQSPARYAFAEPATLGEAFIPKQGNRGRSMMILQEAASWYGAEVVPRREQGWYAGTMQTSSTSTMGAARGDVDERVLARAVRAALVGVAVHMDGRVVGAIQGRDADIRRRGG